MELTWSTATESHTKSFEVQHSPDGNTWQLVGTVAAAGNSQREKSYRLLHTKPVSANFYRIRQIDLDGRFSFSKVISVRFDGEGKSLLIYPNPAKDVLTLYLLHTQEVKILNLKGEQMWSGRLSAGRHVIRVNHLMRGIYIIRSSSSGIQKMILQ